MAIDLPLATYNKIYLAPGWLHACPNWSQKRHR